MVTREVCNEGAYQVLLKTYSSKFLNQITNVAINLIFYRCVCVKMECGGQS